MAVVDLSDPFVEFPAGKSMRPFLCGGRAVWYKPLTKSELSGLLPGDILVLENGPRRFIHRLVEKPRNGSREGVIVTKGDPLLAPERVPARAAVGKVTGAVWRNEVPISLEKGLMARLHKVYSRWIVRLYVLEKKGGPAGPVFGRRDFRFRGYLYQYAYFLALHPLFSAAIRIATTAERLRRKAALREERASVWSFLRIWAKGEIGDGDRPTVGQIQAVLNQELAGLTDWRAENRPGWRPLVEQKKRQCLSAVRALQQFETIALRCLEKGISVIPLKAASLYHSIYREDPSVRDTGDVDLLILPEAEEDFRRCAAELGFRPLKSSRLMPEILKIAKKFEMISENSSSFDLDVKLGPVTKRLIGRFVNLTAESVFARASAPSGETFPLLLHPVDEWLYLAQHYVLHHRLSGMKWLVDLDRLASSLSAENREELRRRADEAGLKKTAAASVFAMERILGSAPPEWRSFLSLKLGPFARAWLNLALEPKNLLNHRFSPRHNNLLDKIESIHWELLFIDRRADQRRAFLGNLFPSRRTMDAYWSRRLGWRYFVIYPFHVFLWLLTGLVFVLDLLARKAGSVLSRQP